MSNAWHSIANLEGRTAQALPTAGSIRHSSLNPRSKQ